MASTSSGSVDDSQLTSGPRDHSLSPSSQLVSAGDHRNRSRVRSIVPAKKKTKPQETAPRAQYSSSSSSESDGEPDRVIRDSRVTRAADNQSPYRDSNFPGNSREDAANVRGRADYSSFRLGERQEEGNRNRIEQSRPSTEVRSVRLRAKPKRIVWEPEFKHKETKQKAKKAVKNAIKIKPVKIQPIKAPEDKTPGCWERFKARRKSKKPEDEEMLEPEEEPTPPSTELSPEMEKANNESYGMMKNIFFPSIPSVLQDVWVYLELGISMAAFGIAMTGLFPIESNREFQIVYLVLTCIAMAMALLDGFIYFFQLGSCARAVRFFARTYKERKRRRSGDEEEEEEEEDQKKRCGMSAQTRDKLNSGFELIRNLVNEFLVYPLLVFDLFDYISEGLEDGFVPDPGQSVDQADFGFFVIGSFYLLLAVYIMRIVMVFGTLASLIRLPSNKEASGSDKGSSLMIKFCIHVIGQIFVHLVIILVIAAKIRNENLPGANCPPLISNTSNSTVNSTDNNMVLMMNVTSGNDTMDDPDEGSVEIQASGFLIAACVMGGVLPLAGVAAFFVVNYFWMREFSIGFWLNMLSMLQGASFAETVFGGEGLSSAKEQADEFLDDSGFDTVKQQISSYKNQSFWTKFFYPTKVPLVALAGVMYDLALVTFVGTLMLTHDEHGIRIVVFCNDKLLTSTFIIAITTITIANLHVLLLLNFLILVLLVLIVFAFLYTVTLLPVLLFIYLPILGLAGYYFLFKDTFESCCKKSEAYQVENDYIVANINADEFRTNENHRKVEELEMMTRKEDLSVQVELEEISVAENQHL